MMKNLIMLIAALCLFACEVQKESNSAENIWVYTKITSTDLNSVNCKIKIVGNDGNSVSGAIVNAVNPANKTIALEYTNGEYSGYFDALISGEYRFLIKTINDGKVQTIEKTFSHIAITEKPKIITVSDETGVSALNGENLDCSKKINIGWEKTKGTIYIVTIQSNSSTVYSANTTENYLVIPAKTLIEDTNYSVSVTAQYLDGDPFLYFADYTSQSSCKGTSIYFRTGSNNEKI